MSLIPTVDNLDLLGEIIASEGMEGFYRSNNPDNLSFSQYLLATKIRMRASFSLMRVFLLYLFFMLDKEQINPFLQPLIHILIIHECIILANFLQYFLATILNRLLLINDFYVATRIVDITDVIANVLFFGWFIYGNFLIMTDKKELAVSLIGNMT